MRNAIMAVAIMMLTVGMGAPALAAGDADLARVAAKAAGVTQKQARTAIDAMKEEILARVKAGEAVRLKGFGRFYVQHREAHKARNPKTGKQVQVPARNYLRFKAYDSANKRLN